MGGAQLHVAQVGGERDELPGYHPTVARTPLQGSGCKRMPQIVDARPPGSCRRDLGQHQHPPECRVDHARLDATIARREEDMVICCRAAKSRTDILTERGMGRGMKWN